MDWAKLFKKRATRPRSQLERIFIKASNSFWLLFLFALVFENWRGWHDWERYKAVMQAQGEHLDMASFIPPPVPDEKNFALTPLLRPLFDYTRDPGTLKTQYKEPNPPVNALRVELKNTEKSAPLPAQNTWTTGRPLDLQAWQKYYRITQPDMKLAGTPEEDVLAALGSLDTMLDELRREREARPLARFPVKYEETVQMELPHLTVLRNIGKILALRAAAELKSNRADAAFADVEFNFGLMDALRDEPLLFSQLLRISMARTAIQPVWEGIAERRWTDAQLTEIEAQLRRLDFLDDYAHSLRVDRANFSTFWEKVHHDPAWVAASLNAASNRSDDEKNGPFLTRILTTAASGIIYQNQLNQAIYLQGFISVVDAKNRKVDFALLAMLDEHLEKESKSWSPYNFVTRLAATAYEALPMTFVQAQTYTDEALIACEIERYRIAHGGLPATLDDLHMANFPHDIINGLPLHYVVTGASYLLYSVGWNQTDDGGKIVMKSHSTLPDYKQGDCVWSLNPL